MFYKYYVSNNAIPIVKFYVRVREFNLNIALQES